MVEFHLKSGPRSWLIMNLFCPRPEAVVIQDMSWAEEAKQQDKEMKKEICC